MVELQTIAWILLVRCDKTKLWCAVETSFRNSRNTIFGHQKRNHLLKFEVESWDCVVVVYCKSVNTFWKEGRPKTPTKKDGLLIQLLLLLLVLQLQKCYLATTKYVSKKQKQGQNFSNPNTNPSIVLSYFSNHWYTNIKAKQKTSTQQPTTPENKEEDCLKPEAPKDNTIERKKKSKGKNLFVWKRSVATSLSLLNIIFFITF